MHDRLWSQELEERQGERWPVPWRWPGLPSLDGSAPRRLRHQHPAQSQSRRRPPAPRGLPHHQRPARLRKTWTGPYIKICSTSARDLQGWTNAYLSTCW